MSSKPHSVVAEIKALIKLATPVSLTQLCIMGMSATDVLIAGKAGTVELAGMNLGVNTWNMIVFFFMGIGFATQPLVAKQFGAGSIEGVRHQLQQSLWLCSWLGLLATACALFGAWLLGLTNIEPTMLSIAQRFLVVISSCAVPVCLIPALRGTLEGMNLTRVVFFISFVAFLVNIPLDYVLVNGLYGFPRLGGVGCAVATSCLMWLSALSTFFVLRWHAQTRHKRLLSAFEKPVQSTLVGTLRLGVPIGASIVIELSMFSGAGMLIAAFGPVQAGAHALAITVAALSFMIYMGLAQGVTIRASQFLGAGAQENAWFTIKIGSAFNLSISVIICVTFILFTEPLIRLFSNDEAVIEVAVVLLYFGAAFQIADCLQVAMVHALRAFHDTTSPPKYQMAAFWAIGLPVGVGLSFYNWVPSLSQARGMWFAMVVSLTLVGVLLFRRLLTYRRLSLAQKANVTI